MHWDAFEDPNINKNLLHNIFPWGYGGSKLCLKNKSKEGNNKKISKENHINIWKRRTDFSAFSFVGFLTVAVIIKIIVDVTHKEESKY